MSYKDELDLWISEMETKVSNLKKHAKNKEEIITRKIASLLDFVEKKAREDKAISIRKKLSSLLRKVSYHSLTLEEVEKEVNSIYGEQSQSQNDTWYFSKRRQEKESSEEIKKWQDISLEEAEAIIEDVYGDQDKNETFHTRKDRKASYSHSLYDVEEDVQDVYGDQSQNDAWYFSRRQRMASSDQPTDIGGDWYDQSLEEVEKKMDGLYGDQSSNDTWYNLSKTSSRSRKQNWYEKVSYDVSPDQFRLKSTEFDEYDERNREGDSALPGPAENVIDLGYDNEVQEVRDGLKYRYHTEYQSREAMMPDGGDPAYFTNNDIDTWHQQVDLDRGNFVDPHVDGHGYSQWDQEPDEEAHVIQDRDRGIPSPASPEVKESYWNN